ncbi:hypothetical protein N9B73_13595 [Verrucomicrobiales bacterium]|jgi:hypothetical protein|nr:hypothetical protein [Verrucomicrobiales bacterium]|tara:strand:- start:228 stop:581 length:354 start_codon:yes stop_codon:yes gene_type:complete
MKNTVIALLVAILVVAVVNLLSSLGVIGGGAAAASGANYEYKALNAQQMDAMGFRAVAEEEGIDVSEDGEINFPKEMVEKIAKVNMLPRTIIEVEKDGGWSFVTVTGDNHYLFRRAK